ncbi:MAG: hypothetical protein HXY34_13210 [Candidatus Thorarchaeota archaeon]|nr:hypothetical protein [Candidatus Thorarchaeota archaeon]
MREAVYKVSGGKMLRVNMDVTERKIKSVKITGDFFLYPEETLEAIEKALLGHELDSARIESTIESVLLEHEAQFIGASSADVAHVIMLAAGISS